MMKSRLSALFALLILALLMSGCISQANDANGTKKGTGAKLAVIHFSVEFPDRTEAKDWLFPAGGNLVQAFRQAFQVGARQYAFGEMVESINGINAGAGQYWALYIDGNYATKGLSDYKAVDGMSVAWKLEKT